MIIRRLAFADKQAPVPALDDERLAFAYSFQDSFRAPTEEDADRFQEAHDYLDFTTFEAIPTTVADKITKSAHLTNIIFLQSDISFCRIVISIPAVAAPRTSPGFSS
ncbi:MAG: hypothetical protein WAJ94_00185 [Candidatus Cybelea sp.]